MRLTLVITTYERPDALAAVLASVARQTEPPDELIVADDGSGTETRAVIEKHAAAIHVRQEHEGFRLTRLRNAATARATGDFIVFVDGDMLLHPAFIGDHRRFARDGFFTQGMRLQANTTGLDRGRALYTMHSPALSDVTRRLANTFVAIKGCNQGYWREHLLTVNGFNEAMVGWGPEDKELAARLGHRGIRRQTLLFGGIAWHLQHPPVSRERRAANEAILAQTRAQRLLRCERGLDAHLHG